MDNVKGLMSFVPFQFLCVQKSKLLEISSTKAAGQVSAALPAAAPPPALASPPAPRGKVCDPSTTGCRCAASRRLFCPHTCFCLTSKGKTKFDLLAPLKD